MDATASAVMGDVMAIGRDMLSGAKRRTPIMGYRADQIDELPIKSMSDIVSQYYLRFSVVDAPGVLSQISGVLGKYNISIQSMIQPERHAADAVPIVIMTHDAKEANINQALAEIDELEIIQQPTRLIRVENNLG